MNVGDRVRLLTGTEQGIVTRLLDSELVEVAIDNDFTIPVLRREVVVIAADEGAAFTRPNADYRPGKANQNPGRNASKKDNTKPREATPASQARQPTLAEALAAVASSGPAAAKAAGAQGGKIPTPQPAAKGLYLALVNQAPELLSVHLVNNTEAEVLFTYGEETAARPHRALAAGQVGPRAASQPLAHFHLKDFEQWPAIVVQLLPHRNGGDTAYELLTKRQAFKATTFYNSRRPAPVIQKEAYLFQLDERPAAALTPEKLAELAAPTPPPAANSSEASRQEGQIDVAALRAQLTGDAPVPAKPAAVVAAAPQPAPIVTAPPHEVDLHLEALRPDGNKDEELSNAAILRLQLDAFEDALIRALATNMHEIIFIHGTGNGVLRKEIHRQLSRNKDIKFFEDAQKEKFGFGATLVRLK
ncbi:Smr/MutS family protein [uncultured Hymenobacter sp.]|uniref:Smr/MutS family protein n=1 Tax=uncultured Hymenobacter sp. TaxID=170016 RepID=UPI0035C9D574